jgi:hypothetical protein
MTRHGKAACLAAALALGVWAPRAAAQAAAPADSPFAPPPGSAAATAAGGAAPSYELAGASATPDGTEVCVYDAQSKRSSWIAVGASRDGIRVISYDPERDQAVVSVNGENQVLPMRKATVAASSAAQAPGWGPSMPFYVAPSSGQPAGPPAQPPPEPADPKARELARQEREARMMVSDLMEIGMQQRKAYAEAKRKAALKAASDGQ